jgi:hypothetical protein
MALNTVTQTEELIQAIVHLSHGEIYASEVSVIIDFEFNQVIISTSGVSQMLPADELHRRDPRTRVPLYTYMLHELVRGAMHPVIVKTRKMARQER